MPHVIFNGNADMDRVHSDFCAGPLEQEGWIIRLMECYRATTGRTLMFECTAVRSGFSQNFYARAEQKGESVTIRIDPTMKIERNEGVQRTVALIAERVFAAGGLTFDKSNLPEKIMAWLRPKLS